MSKNNTLLIDGDMVVFQVTVGHEQEIQWDDEIHTLHSRFSDCTDSFTDYIKNLTEELDGITAIFAFSGHDNFRKQVSQDYKSNRKKTRKPLAYKRLREHIESLYPNKCVDNLEADDVLGILATSGQHKNPIIVSDDKDLLSIPGRTYRLGELHDISEEQADRAFLTQALTGDVTDGYKGCPGVGPKKAESILQTLDWSNVVSAYEAAGLTEHEALTQARLARILRASDWDQEKKEVILWQPPLASV